MTCINLRVSVPFCSFRKPYAREFLETERFPPPATVYGFLLSLVGEEDRHIYTDTQIAIAVTKQPAVSQVLRTVWRVKNKKKLPGTGSNKRPDYQEVLSGLEMGVWVAEGALADRLRSTGDNPGTVVRYGGLSLGESRDLVNEVCFHPDWQDNTGVWLVCDNNGRNPLPVWVDHVGAKETHWVQFGLKSGPLEVPPRDDARWITIGPRHGATVK